MGDNSLPPESYDDPLMERNPYNITNNHIEMTTMESSAERGTQQQQQQQQHNNAVASSSLLKGPLLPHKLPPTEDVPHDSNKVLTPWNNIISCCSSLAYHNMLLARLSSRQQCLNLWNYLNAICIRPAYFGSTKNLLPSRIPLPKYYLPLREKEL